ncbi:eukaryotic translation initiation factor 3 subunit 8 N-terminus-domain-containing protein [Suillus subalutaceus]|uniref:eukaryotic translation initiation factor 3 subunit 8 N-terminus-domain-containing protein n=1 Tax=Suillus subalutaceus TaxID=48586 RepID=UPI001B861A72|nr:eukaryotic translation initiation factor 3 subunit 8 N-terminus-domain-containing protein [Suillus subalutaceus]KAG1852892.1 eukaryotic translation initiation factor 3 subunit 8 N-terminus-domain-containing protein [Suillus subalutaceus]
MSRFFRQAGDSDSDTEESDEELLTSGDEDAAAPKAAAKPAMSRFLRTAGSDSSSSDSESSDEDEPTQKKKSRFMRGDSDEDSEDEDVKRVVKSTKDKRLEEIEATGKVMDNGLKINDWVAISNEFDKLLRLVQRQSNAAETTLLSLENSLNAALTKEKEAKKKMNATNARALNSMKQKVRKTTKEFEKEVQQYQNDPEAFEREFAAHAQPADVVVPKPKKQKKGADSESDGEPVLDDRFTTVGKGGKAMSFSADNIFKTLKLIHEARGKKNTDRGEQIRILEKLLEVAVTSYQRIRILLALVSSRFDYNSSITSYMPTDLWLSAQHEVDQLISIVVADSSYSVQEDTEDYDELVERHPATESGGVVRIRGSIISFVDRLDDEFTKSLQNIDPHGTEYIDRLKDEKVLYRTISRSQAFYEQTSQPEPLRELPDAVVSALESSLASSEITPSVTLASSATTSSLIHSLCVHLYKADNSLLRTRAMLSHIYHHALHNDFYTARDMLLMSHLQESIHSADVATQILYNRTVLLAQGVHQQRFQQQLTPEQEKAERSRQLPFHMHINTELLEAAFLVSSMLVEVPLLASIESEEQKRKAISKPFRRLLDFADRQVFTGPPESTRDHIMQASKALQDGEWEKCRDLIQSIKIWTLMPEVSSVKEMLAKRIQEQGLRTYLFTYAPYYSTLSLSLLSRTFSLPLRSVTSMISKMIWNEELSASLDQSTGHSRPQQLAQVIADKVSALLEQNEKVLDIKLGGSGGWGDRSGDKGEKRGEQTQERRGRGDRTRGSLRGGPRGRGSRFAQGLGNQMTRVR